MVPITRPLSMIGKQTRRLQAVPLGHRGAGAGLHLAQVGHEDEVSRLPGLAVEPLSLAESRLGRDPPEVLADRARILREPQGLLLGLDLPERPVGPAERLADGRQGRGDHVADSPGPGQGQEQLVDRRGVGDQLLLAGLGLELLGHDLPGDHRADVAAVLIDHRADRAARRTRARRGSSPCAAGCAGRPAAAAGARAACGTCRSSGRASGRPSSAGGPRAA